MKKKKIEKIIFNILMLLPLLLILVYFALNFANIWQNHGSLNNSIILTNFNEIMANFTLNTEFTSPIKYLLYDIFNLSETLSESIGNYIMWLVLIELLHVLYDLVIFIPRALRSIIDRGIKE